MNQVQEHVVTAEQGNKTWEATIKARDHSESEIIKVSKIKKT